ncbi:ATP-binding cassette domain-containing protein [Chloroflexi bacterium TSY]|nr:ATP-binding cassette domain-containing protein [Chloroflexi bacterium TSY]
MFARTPLRAVDDVSFRVHEGETVGLVGESGSGKTTLGMCVLRLTDPSSGTILFDGNDFTAARGDDLRQLRRQLQIVFQSPLDSLNPRMTVGETVTEPLLLHGLATTRTEGRRQVIELFERVNLGEEHLDRYPHQLSGGQRQRVSIARALSTDPKLIVLDEPTSALDVSVQAQLLNLLRTLQDELGLSFIFISHDLAVVSHLADKVAVMYLGQIVEFGPTEQVFHSPRHPYTMSLLSAIPGESLLSEEQRIVLSGEIPSPLKPPTGCRFHTRCPFAKPTCQTEEQTLQPIRAGDESRDHVIACGRVDEGAIPHLRVEDAQNAIFTTNIQHVREYLRQRRPV